MDQLTHAGAPLPQPSLAHTGESGRTMLAEWAMESSLPVVAESTEDPRHGPSPATCTLFFPARGTHFPS